MTVQTDQAARRRAHRPQLPPDPRPRPGAALVSREALRALPPPPRSHTWQPLPHEAVVTMAEDALATAGHKVRAATYALGRSGRRLAAILDLEHDLVEDVYTRLVVRSNQDRSGSLGLGVGCWQAVSGAAWVYRLENYRLRYTPGVLCRVPKALRQTLDRLPLYVDVEAGAIRRLLSHDMTGTHADAVFLHALEQGVLRPRELPEVLRLYRSGVGMGLRPWTAYGLLLALCAGMGRRWARDVDACRRLHAARYLVGYELAGIC